MKTIQVYSLSRIVINDKIIKTILCEIIRLRIDTVVKTRTLGNDSVPPCTWCPPCDQCSAVVHFLPDQKELLRRPRNIITRHWARPKDFGEYRFPGNHIPTRAAASSLAENCRREVDGKGDRKSVWDLWSSPWLVPRVIPPRRCNLSNIKWGF